MMRGLLLVLLVATAARGTEPPAFQHARPMLPGSAGANRLAVDPPLLTGARPLRFDASGRLSGGLDDLRLSNAAGEEVPYLVLAPPSPERYWRVGRLQATEATKETSGFEADLGEVVRVDRVRLGGLPAPLLKRARLEASGERQRWVVLAQETIVFDLTEEGLRRLEIGFDPTPVRFLRLTWDDVATPKVLMPATVSIRTAEVAQVPPTFVPVAFERRESEPGTSRFRIRLPGPGLPIRAFELECGGDYLLRSARVYEARLTGDAVTPRELGNAVLRRVTRGGVAASDLRIAVTMPRELQVELVVDDANNPPLDLRAVRAELPPLPTLYFESADGGALTAKFGVPDLSAPRYDLEAARAGLLDTPAAQATWGERTSLPMPPKVPRDEPPMEVVTGGAIVDLAAFRWVRSIPEGPAGLTALRLDAAVLAHSNGLADVRLVDGAGRQIPYVVEHASEPLVVALAPPVSEPLPAEEGKPRGTTHRIELPYRRLPEARLVLETSERVFERSIVVRGERRVHDPRAQERVGRLLTVTWRHVDPEYPAVALTLDLPPLDGTTVLLDVHDGDNRPLVLSSVRLLLPTRRLRFVRTEESAPVLAYGAEKLAAPRYDLTLLAPRILGARAHEADPLPEPASPQETADEESADATGRRVFWAVLAVAVVVLLAVLGRLLRMEQRTGAA